MPSRVLTGKLHCMFTFSFNALPSCCVPATPEHCEPHCALIGLNRHIYPLLHPLKLSTLKPVTSALHIMSATITHCHVTHTHRHVTHKPTPGKHYPYSLTFIGTDTPLQLFPFISNLPPPSSLKQSHIPSQVQYTLVQSRHHPPPSYSLATASQPALSRSSLLITVCYTTIPVFVSLMPPPALPLTVAQHTTASVLTLPSGPHPFVPWPPLSNPRPHCNSLHYLTAGAVARPSLVHHLYEYCHVRQPKV
ncbi:hypothetical protein BD779DRAFT_1678509 [Infundibulicybe gibba]|nr:hypothetical protein BD779DRAFT_1678509 [Infundibulicybe gibba]